jgi:hypothetical protein
MLGVGGAKKTYVEDVFSTYLYTGNDSSYRNINNGIDLAGEGGMVWVRPRNNTIGINVFDTARGATKRLHTDADYAESTDTSRLDQFNSNGFRVNGNYSTNGPSSYDYTSWSFRKSSMFDVVTYTGTGTNTNSDGHLDVNHQLGSVPGMVIVKRYSGSSNWWVYHRGMANNSKSLFLQSSNSNSGSSNYWNNTAPTASQFTVGEWLNVNGSTYVAYLFAGGESTAATARSVDFDGSDDGLAVANSSDFSFGSGDFTVEGWAQIDQNSSQNALIGMWRYQNGRRSWTIQTDNSTNHLEFFVNSGGGTATNHGTSGGNVPVGQWFHFAGVRHGNTIKLFINGEKVAETAYTSSLYNNTLDPLYIGNQSNGTDFTNGRISNIRITKGQALYTTSFKVPTEPLTTTSQGAIANNVKLLCCNNSSATGSTVTPTTITTGPDGNSNPTALTDSPFDDPAGFVFGENEDQGIIKCGNYRGESSHSTRLEVNLGFEPQWVLIKNADSTKDWVILDSMRRWEGDADDQNVSWLVTNDNQAENNGQMSGITPTGFVCQSSSLVNGGSDNFVYVAIRRPDPLVQKPAKLGTDVFAMDTGDGNPSALPSMDSNFPVDFGTIKLFASAQGWYTGSRLTGSKVVFTNSTNAASNNSILEWDSNEGFWKNLQSTYQGWMWKRHAGFDCLFYKGDAVTGRVIRHNLSKPPEMIWIKKLDQAEAWAVGHKDLDGGNEPWTHYLQLESTASEQDYPLFNDEAPSSNQFAIHQNDMVNGSSHKYVAMLFASTAVSKVGSYSGSGGSGNAQNIGFQPRFLMVKRVDSSGAWLVFDSLRTTSNPFRYQLELNTPNQQDFVNKVTVSSTGWSFIDSNINESGSSYIYYAHA